MGFISYCESFGFADQIRMAVVSNGSNSINITAKEPLHGLTHTIPEFVCMNRALLGDVEGLL